MTLVYTGLRPKEARWIKRANVLLDDAAPRILVENHKVRTKTKKSKIVAIIPRLLPLLKEWEERTKREYPDCEWFFHVGGERYDADRLDTEWDRVCRACRIPKGTVLYDSRRTNSVLLDKQGVSKEDRKTQMGHTTDAMSDLCNQTSIAHVERIQEKFGRMPTVRVADWKAELQELKDTFEAGLLPEDLYKAECADVMKRRARL